MSVCLQSDFEKNASVLHTPSRRDFCVGAGAALGLTAIPMAAHAGPFGLVAGRFFAGLVYNITYAVFVQLASNYIVSQIRGGYSPSNFASLPASHARPLEPPTKSSTFYQPDNYQVSLAIAGLAELEVSRTKKISAFLSEASDTELERLDSLKKHLYDNQVDAAFYSPQPEASRRISPNDGLADLLSIKYIVASDDDLRTQYRKLIENIGSDIFDPALV